MDDIQKDSTTSSITTSVSQIISNELENCPVCRQLPIHALRLNQCNHILCKMCYLQIADRVIQPIISDQVAYSRTRNPYQVINRHNDVVQCPTCREPVLEYPTEETDLDLKVKESLGDVGYARRLKDEHQREKNRKRRLSPNRHITDLLPPDEREIDRQREVRNVPTLPRRRNHYEVKQKMHNNKLQKVKTIITILRYFFEASLIMCLLSFFAVALLDQNINSSAVATTVLMIIFLLCRYVILRVNPWEIVHFLEKGFSTNKGIIKPELPPLVQRRMSEIQDLYEISPTSAVETTGEIGTRSEEESSISSESQ